MNAGDGRTDVATPSPASTLRCAGSTIATLCRGTLKARSQHINYSFVALANWRHINALNNNRRRVTTITEDTRETTFLFQRLSVALRRGNAVSFHDTMVTE